MERIQCMKCIHYQVTFDPQAPRGCKLYQFKSATMPYVLVKQSTGHDCHSFQEKTKTEWVAQPRWCPSPCGVTHRFLWETE